jgi:hypothetical protein
MPLPPPLSLSPLNHRPLLLLDRFLPPPPPSLLLPPLDHRRPPPSLLLFLDFVRPVRIVPPLLPAACFRDKEEDDDGSPTYSCPTNEAGHAAISFSLKRLDDT